MTAQGIRIDRRFNGPPDSGNGGYVAGRLAAFLASPSARVRLSAPPPLDVALEVRRREDAVELVGDERTFARAVPTDLRLEPPMPPTWDEAVAASRHFRGFEEHVFPSCFVCGPARAEGDGLRLFPGPVPGRDLFACPWIPGPGLADAEGRVAPEFLWAALDCPGCFSFPQPISGPILLGELEVRLDDGLRAGERCVVSAWSIDQSGRKHRTGTALHGEDGRLVGVGVATWIEIHPAAG